MLKYQRKGILIFLSILIVLFTINLAGPLPRAHAGLWDWMTGISELPSDVSDLKSKYDQIEQSFKANQEQYEKVMQQLNLENEQLRFKNDQLSERVQLLEAENLQQQKHVSWFIKGTLTFIGLLLFSFVATRVIRIMVWRRSPKERS
ncbi:hypothetical protein E0485_13155 [Paenibacillus albiflavus]|uniref:Uncharacterized protein n=1 Tax=Paenibacillus albiflavus TaxID=2545760 RepID=A0A4R4EES7_9BACL|nr:hypothetical protein [Paenibacillus albiflavus]TCZ76545.1 hypothetical protein E0485_13155 [Paenibacillus albiflavus]